MIYETYNTVYNEDCRSVLVAYKRNNFKADLVFADPPFNIGQQYGTYNDNLSASDYYQFNNQWLGAAYDSLREGGLLLVHIPDKCVDNVIKRCSDFKNFPRIAWIVWNYRFAQCRRGGFINSKAFCLVYWKGNEPHTFNDDEVMEVSDRHAIYGDNRTLESDTPGERCMFDVWHDIPRLVGNSREKIPNHPNQLPEAYCERLLLAYTKPKNVVFELFGGTGTMSAVAKRNGRNSIACEIDEAYCTDIKKRLLQTPAARFSE